MSDTIARTECPVCGEPMLDHWRCSCDSEPVERIYVAVDALESDAAVLAGAQGLRDAAGSSKLRDHYRAAIRAAVEAVTS